MQQKNENVIDNGAILNAVNQKQHSENLCKEQQIKINSNVDFGNEACENTETNCQNLKSICQNAETICDKHKKIKLPFKKRIANFFQGKKIVYVDGVATIKTTAKPVSTVKLAKIAMLTAVSFILYMYVKFPLPLFPAFLDIQFSELPALLAGFSLGPVSGCLVIVLKCLLKLPFSSTSYSGELTDILLGIAFVLPASLIYRHKKSRKNAIIGLAVGSILLTFCSVLVNYFISVPLYLELFFKGNWAPLLGTIRPMFPNVTVDNFYTCYLFGAIVPFNLIRCLFVSLLTFITYKGLSKALHWEPIHKHKKTKNQTNGDVLLMDNVIDDKQISGRFLMNDEQETEAFAQKIAETLVGGEILLLDGDLGAGKTTFTKSLAKALGVEENVTSPTFTILNTYESGRLPLYHLDMYRIENADELYETGVEEYLAMNGVTVIEWNKLNDLTGKIITMKIERIDDTKRIFIVETENRL